MKPKGKRILVVDDDGSIQRILRRNLIASGYEVLVADDGGQAIELVRVQQPDLILLDLWLPGEIDGMGVCMQVRQWTQTPIIILSARTEERQKVQALDLGADDYLTKPFSNDELQARVRACLRRVAGLTDSESLLQKPEVLISEDKHISMHVLSRQVRVGEREVKLTPTEFSLLLHLMVHAGKVLTHRNILRTVWGPEYGEEADYLRVYIRQLRRKIEEQSSQPHYILTEPGVGYVFRVQVSIETQGQLTVLNQPPAIENGHGQPPNVGEFGQTG
ncbi:MAG: response regulator transcription factor [Ktedonobacteraceae bacterium]